MQKPRIPRKTDDKRGADDKFSHFHVFTFLEQTSSPLWSNRSRRAKSGMRRTRLEWSDAAKRHFGRAKRWTGRVGRVGRVFPKLLLEPLSDPLLGAGRS